MEKRHASTSMRFYQNISQPNVEITNLDEEQPEEQQMPIAYMSKNNFFDEDLKNKGSVNKLFS